MKIRLTEQDLANIVREAVNRIRPDRIYPGQRRDLFDILAMPNNHYDRKSPYAHVKSPEKLRFQGYDENGIKDGKKYYDAQLYQSNYDPKSQRAAEFVAGYSPYGFIKRDMERDEKKEQELDKKWQQAADTRKLYGKNSPNNDIPNTVREETIRNIVRETIDAILSEEDRHRPGYWKERWAKQKAEKQTQANADGENAASEPKKNPSKPKKDRHRKGYYHDYNQAHPERLNRGFTKGYNNGNVEDGPKEKKRQWLNKTLGIYIIGYDEMGRPITNNPLGDMLRNKEMEWHDDDWEENSD